MVIAIAVDSELALVVQFAAIRGLPVFSIYGVFRLSDFVAWNVLEHFGGVKRGSTVHHDISTRTALWGEVIQSGLKLIIIWKNSNGGMIAQSPDEVSLCAQLDISRGWCLLWHNLRPNPSVSPLGITDHRTPCLLGWNRTPCLRGGKGCNNRLDTNGAHDFGLRKVTVVICGVFRDSECSEGFLLLLGLGSLLLVVAPSFIAASLAPLRPSDDS